MGLSTALRLAWAAPAAASPVLRRMRMATTTTTATTATAAIINIIMPPPPPPPAALEASTAVGGAVGDIVGAAVGDTVGDCVQTGLHKPDTVTMTPATVKAPLKVPPLMLDSRLLRISCGEAGGNGFVMMWVTPMAVSWVACADVSGEV